MDLISILKWLLVLLLKIINGIVFSLMLENVMETKQKCVLLLFLVKVL